MLPHPQSPSLTLPRPSSIRYYCFLCEIRNPEEPKALKDARVSSQSVDRRKLDRQIINRAQAVGRHAAAGASELLPTVVAAAALDRQVSVEQEANCFPGC